MIPLVLNRQVQFIRENWRAREFARIAELDAETKQQAEAAKRARSTIELARKIGDAELVRSAAKHKLKSPDLQAIQTELHKLTDGPRAKIIQQLKEGKITRAEQVKRAARTKLTTHGC